MLNRAVHLGLARKMLIELELTSTPFSFFTILAAESSFDKFVAIFEHMCIRFP
jgi:hypothetical protein